MQFVQVALVVAPVSDEYLPTEQGKHAVEVLLPPNGLYLPAEQLVQDNDPGETLNEPAEQLVQDNDPGETLNEPAGHCEHAALPRSEQFEVQGLEESEQQQLQDKPILVGYEPAPQRMVYGLLQQRGGSATGPGGVHSPPEAVPKDIKGEDLQPPMDPCAR